MNWEKRIQSALLKAQRAIVSGGIDPASGYTLENIEGYIMLEPPVECDTLADAALRKIESLKAMAVA